MSAFANCGHNSFWAKKLLERGYLFDVFRQKFWGDDRVGPWYRQNTFVYVKPHHPLFRALTVDGHGACDSLAFLDCIHPWLYFHVLDELKKRSPPLAHAAPPELVQKLPRNELCHCGSGKRFNTATESLTADWVRAETGHAAAPSAARKRHRVMSVYPYLERG